MKQLHIMNHFLLTIYVSYCFFFLLISSLNIGLTDQMNNGFDDSN